MKSVSAALADHLAAAVTTLATCWHITRRDGQTYHFTDHDRDLEVDGATYLASTGYSRTAISNDASLSVDNLDVEGVFDSAAITEADLRAGLFDQAEVHIFLVNWADPTMGVLRLRRGWFGEVTLSEQGMFRTELRGMTQRLQQRMGALYSPECRADLGDARCRVPILPPEIARNATYAEGDVVRVRNGGAAIRLDLPILNGDFSMDGEQVYMGFAPTGWTLVSGDWDTHDSGNGALAPQSGSYYLDGGYSASGELSQSVDLLAAGCDPAVLDAGLYHLEFSIQRGNSFSGDLGRVVVDVRDAAQDVVSVVYDTGFEEITPEGVWVARGITEATLPEGSRVLRIRLFHERVLGGQSNASFDSVTAALTTLDTSTQPTSAEFANRTYRCVSAGTTAGTQPGYDTTLGTQTTDGTAVFVAEEAWTRAGTVTAVLDRTIITAAIEEPRAVDGWFTGGLLTWETGANAGRAIEISDWVQETGTLTLFLPMGYAVAPGDAFRIHPGCDKRLETCRTRFDNVLNFRGEPYVPGQDALMSYPDAR